MHAPTRVGGVILATHNVPRLVKWYQDLGLPLADDGSAVEDDGDSDASRQAGGPAFSIQKARGELPGAGGDLRDEPYGMQRVTLGLHVADLDDVLADLRQRDVAVAGPRDDGSGRVAWAKDPDGNLVELRQAQRP